MSLNTISGTHGGRTGRRASEPVRSNALDELQKVPKILWAVESKSHRGRVTMVDPESKATPSLQQVTDIIAVDFRWRPSRLNYGPSATFISLPAIMGPV